MLRQCWKTTIHKSRRPSLHEGEKYVKMILEENPDVTDSEVVAFLKLLGWNSKEIEASKKAKEVNESPQREP